MVTVIDGPQPVALIDHQAQYGIKEVRLNRAAGVGYGRALNPLEQFVASRPRLGMHGKKNSTFPIDRDIANRLGIVEDFFELRIAYAGRLRQVTIRVSTPIAHAQDYSHKQCKRQQDYQEILQCSYAPPDLIRSA